MLEALMLVGVSGGVAVGVEMIEALMLVGVSGGGGVMVRWL